MESCCWTPKWRILFLTFSKIFYQSLPLALSSSWNLFYRCFCSPLFKRSILCVPGFIFSFCFCFHLARFRSESVNYYFYLLLLWLWCCLHTNLTCDLHAWVSKKFCLCEWNLHKISFPCPFFRFSPWSFISYNPFLARNSLKFKLFVINS